METRQTSSVCRPGKCGFRPRRPQKSLRQPPSVCRSADTNTGKHPVLAGKHKRSNTQTQCVCVCCAFLLFVFPASETTPEVPGGSVHQTSPGPWSVASDSPLLHSTKPGSIITFPSILLSSAGRFSPPMPRPSRSNDKALVEPSNSHQHARLGQCQGSNRTPANEFGDFQPQHARLHVRPSVL